MTVSRRLMTIAITSELFIDVLRRMAVDAEIEFDPPLPDDAKGQEVFGDSWVRAAVMAVSSESYPELPEGAALPMITVRIKPTVGGVG